MNLSVRHLISIAIFYSLELLYYDIEYYLYLDIHLYGGLALPK